MVYAEGRTREPVLNKPTSKEERERFCLDRRRGARRSPTTRSRSRITTAAQAGHLTPMDIEWAKDGAGRRALHRAGAARDGRLAAPGRACSRSYALQGPGQGARHRARGRHQDRAAARSRIIKDARHLVRVPPGRGAGRRHHDAGLGAGDEDRGGDRHQPRRPHLPRRDRRARARHPGGGRHRATRPTRCSRAAPRSPCPAPRATSAGSTRARVPFEVDDDRSQPRSRSPRPTS